MKGVSYKELERKYDEITKMWTISFETDLGKLTISCGVKERSDINSHLNRLIIRETIKEEVDKKRKEKAK